MKGEIITYWGAECPGAYEQLNLCTDPDRRIEEAMWTVAPFEGKTVLDVGAGSGFHAVRYASVAQHVFAVEPSPGMLRQMHARLSEGEFGNLSVLAATAEAIPLPDGSIDVAHARFAYFFGTEKSLPGIREVKRLLKPGGHFFIIDVNPDRGQFGYLARQAYPHVFREDYQDAHAAFHREHGFSLIPVDTVFRAPDREVLEEVFRMDFPKCYKALMDQIEGTELSYGISIYHFEKR